PNPQPNVCDWPRGTCTYNKEPCPPNWHRCSQFDKGCRLPTNHCCCRNRFPALFIQITHNRCDWPRGACYFKYDPCPANTERCQKYDHSCSKTNHCCCNRPTSKFLQRKLSFTSPNPQPNVCDWPRGTCTYNKEPCPPNWHRCPKFDKGCRLPTNHCCCRR
ncbi:unnamed protein product, partial [Porites lobata]